MNNFKKINRTEYRTGTKHLRWGIYTGELEGTTKRKVEGLLGNRYTGEVIGDGNIYDHQRNQSFLIKKYGKHDIGNSILVELGYLEGGVLNKEELNQLRICGLVHDEGEKKYGDICYDYKDKANFSKKDEFNAGIEEIKKWWKGNNEELNYIISCYQIDFNEKHRLNKLFKMYEKISYLDGLIKAFKNKDNIIHINLLLHGVIRCQFKYISKWYIAGVPSIVKYINTNKEIINNIFNYLAENNCKGENENNHNDFIISKDAWDSI